MPRRGTGRISFAQIIGPSAEDHRADWKLLREVLTPGTMVERYNREWRMGPTVDQGPTVMGRIGYSRQTGTTPVWSDKEMDFTGRAVYDGQTASFAIDRTNLRVAFQFRPPNIKRRSFTGALEDLLNESSGADLWAVEPEFEKEEFDVWTEGMVRVERLQVTIRRPNPNYRGRNKIKSIIEGTESVYAKLIFQAEQGESIDLTDDLITEAIGHASVEGKDYGSFTATGVEANGRQSKYDSNQEGAPDEIRVQLASGQREVPFEDVRRSLTDPDSVGRTLDEEEE